MRNRLISIAIAFLMCICSVRAQENPVVGFSMDRHMGPVISKDFSKRGQILATVAKDQTLMIWGYPTYEFKKAINLPGDNISPVSYGVCAIIPTNPNIVLIADNTGDVYETNLYKRHLKRHPKTKDKENENPLLIIGDDREGLFYDNPSSSITTQYSFIAVDIEQGKVIDRVGSLSSKVAKFVFSTDESLLLVVSQGEEAVLYDTWGLRQVSQFLFEDEKILDACFLNKEELVFFTDINYYKFRISNNALNSAIEKERLIKRSINLWGVKIEQKEGIAYLFSNSRGLFSPAKVSTIKLEDGEIIKKNSADALFAPTAEDLKRNEGVQIFYSRGISNGVVTSMHSDEKPELQRADIIRRKIRKEKIESFLRNELDTINNHLFEYRSKNYAYIETTAEGIKFSYPECSGRFNINGVMITNDTIEIGSSSKKWIKTNDNNAISVNQYSETPQVWKTGNNGFKSFLPIEVHAIYPWINGHHFVVSLTDGSIRWYNTYTGKEELALFVSKEGNYVIWAPNGTYMSDSDALADRIEWRYRRFSNVITTRPVNERLKYYWPNEIKRLIEQLFNPSIKELSTRYSGTNENFLSMNVLADSSSCIVNYSIKNYNPVKYGPFDLAVIIEDDSEALKPIDKYDYVHRPGAKGGEILFSTPERSKNVILELLTTNQDQQRLLAFDRKSLKGEIFPRRIILTCVGINDYSKFKEYSNLNAPIHDAYAVKSVFDDMNSVSMTLENPELYYADVTAETIRKRIDDIRGKSDPETISIMYFSGHGENLGGKFYFVSDMEKIDITSILFSAESIPGYKLFIFDSCYSGASFNAEYERTAIIASSDAITQSFDGSVLQESPFTRLLVNIIQRNSREGNMLSIDELFEEIVNGWERGPQPLLYNNIGKIIIFKP